MLRFLIDENLDQRILRGLCRRFQQLDYVMVEQRGLRGSSDQDLLEWAAKEDRIIITHDTNTMTLHANALLKKGQLIPGLIIVPDQMEIGRVIKDLEIIIECGNESDLRKYSIFRSRTI